MAKLDQTIFAYNGLISSENGNDYYCSICPIDFYNDDWENHVKSPIHIETLKRFNSIFENCGEKVHCTFCSTDFDWKSLRDHGKSHKLIPWHEPEEKFKIFFENRILSYKKQFFCCLCEINFPEWTTAYVHTMESKHRTFKEKADAQIADISLPITNQVTHELLVNEAIIIFDENSLRCKICHESDQVIKFDDISKHLKSFYHTYHKLKFDPKSTITNNENEEEILSSNYIQSKDSTYSNCVVCNCLFYNRQTSKHIEEKRHEDAKKVHGCENIIVCGNESYRCKCCDYQLMGIENVYLHIKEQSHLSAIVKSKKNAGMKNNNEISADRNNPIASEKVRSDEAPLEKLEKISSDSRKRSFEVTQTIETPKKVDEISADRKTPVASRKVRSDEAPMVNLGKIPSDSRKRSFAESIAECEKTEIPAVEQMIGKTDKPDVINLNINDKFIVRKNISEAFCHVCEVSLMGHCEINDHAESEKHKNSLILYGCEFITEIDKFKYECTRCNCGLSSPSCLRDHLKGKRHSKFYETKEVQKTEEKKSAICTKSEMSEIISTVIVAEFSKLLVGLRAKKSTNRGVRSRFRRKIIDEASIAEVQQISCNFCPSVVENSADLHSHLAAHLSREFIDSKMAKNSTVGNSKNSTIENSKNPIVGNSNLDANDNLTVRDVDKSMFNEIDDDDENEIEEKSSIEKIRRSLNFGKNYIYDVTEKLQTIELGMKLCFVEDTKNIYCLVCRKIVADNFQSYFEHLSNLDHSTNLENIEHDHSLFSKYEGQFSELDLANQYMEEKNDYFVRCLVCEIDIDNIDYLLEEHINYEQHELIRNEIHINTRQNFEDIKIRAQCDWYNVEKFWCVPCSIDFKSDVDFVRHLEASKLHRNVMRKNENIDRRLIFDFCPNCALLWYGYKCSFSYHCELSSHKWLARDGYYSLPELTEITVDFIADHEKFVDEQIFNIDAESNEERGKIDKLLRDLENLTRTKFSNVKAHHFGWRTMGLGTSDCDDLDVFLDCGDVYDGKYSSDKIVDFLPIVIEFLRNEPETWNTVDIPSNCKIPIAWAHHRASGILCNISCKNGLSVEATKLIKSINDVFPPCRKLMIFLKRWLEFCNLSGFEKISNYALCWLVIFYLQKETIIPSIYTLIMMKNKSHLISDWEVGVSHEFMYNEEASNYSHKEFLIRFFAFYADFDFRCNVACPFIGEETPKRFFVNFEKLPTEMSRYVDYVKKTDEPLRVDSPMCIQDPFELELNLTKDVSKVNLSRFRTFCSKSLDVLSSI